MDNGEIVRLYCEGLTIDQLTRRKVLADGGPRGDARREVEEAIYNGLKSKKREESP